MKSTMARSLVEQFSKPGDTIYDPFCGAGTVALEAWMAGRAVLAGDLSPYAWVLSKAKLQPPRSLSDAVSRFDRSWAVAKGERDRIDLRRVPKWVRQFYNRETLRETLALGNVLLRRREWYVLACLLGILHHWRPGFLSFPASHTVPHLMGKRYPRSAYPQNYAYRETYPRVLAKIRRSFARVPKVDRQLRRRVTQSDATALAPKRLTTSPSAIITSPPYMNSLSYARDNRLRLWFLGVRDYRSLELALSPRRQRFLETMRKLLRIWADILPAGAPCVLVLGTVQRGGRFRSLPEEFPALVRGSGSSFRVACLCRNVVPPNRKSWVNCRSAREDTIVVLRRQR